MIPLQKAHLLAEKIVTELRPLSDDIAIAGSIRRRIPYVGDIDLVILAPLQRRDAIKQRCLLNARLITNGDQNFICELRTKIQLDIFFADPASEDLIEPKPTNWGSLLLCRTGSRAHNIKIAQRAISLGKKWHPYQGVWGQDPSTGLTTCLASATEEEIFTALEMEYVQPEQRL